MRKQLGWKAPMWGFFWGTLPDLDIIAYPFLEPIDRLGWHRGLSHSILIMVIASVIFGYLLAKLHRKKGITPVQAGWFVFLTWSTHVLIDCFTTYGTQIYEPFATTRVALNNMSIIDLSFTLPMLLALIFAMLAVGAALQNSGAIALIVDNIAPGLAELPPFWIILSVFLLTTTLTEIVSNNAVAVIMTPIAISLAAALGMDARPLVVAVMIAASASFATPIGYQTNTLVYGPGGYRFTDFLKFGVPLNLSLAPIVSFVIPFIWPL